MEHESLSSRLRLAATLLLTGQILYILVTLLHPGGSANDHPAIFTAYAGSGDWTAVHVAQFLCLAILLGGLISLFFQLDVKTRIARWASRFGAALAAAALGIYAIVQAVDGVALKQAVDAWVSAPQSERAARFATAETVRWLEWGTRSYYNFMIGLAFLLLAEAIARTAWIPRAIAYLTALSGIIYLVQGWITGSKGFTGAQSTAIVLVYLVNLIWMIWLLVTARRLRQSEAKNTVSHGSTYSEPEPATASNSAL